MTLADLLKDRTLPVKVKMAYWKADCWYDSYFESENFELYTEPKQPIVRWLWADKDGHVTAKMYSDNEINIKEFNIKLEFSRTEFPG